jgi:dipeptidyl aminopeptidase/acylaminoacyl peptidase
MRRALVLPLLACIGLAPVPAADPHPFSVHDMLAMERISDPQVAPDGRSVVFVLRSTDLEANRGRTDLWRVNVDGSGLRRMTTHEASDWNPRFTVDGEAVLLLSTRSGSSQVWRLPLTGGEAKPVTDLPLDVGNLVVSPDGRHIAFSMEVFVDCADLECTTKRLEEKAESKVSARVYERMFVRHWDTWKDGRRSHLFVMPLDGGAPVDVTAGLDADVPSKPFGGPEEIAFTPAGKGIVFGARVAGASEPWSTDFDLYLAPADGSAAPVDLTADNEAWDTQPVFSPDGKTLSWLAMARPGYESDRFRIKLRPWVVPVPPGGEGFADKVATALSGAGVRSLTEDWDRSPRTIVWSPDGKTIHTMANDLGQRSLFAVDAADGTVRKLVGEGTVRSVANLPGGRLLYGLDHLRSPVELYSVAADGSDVRRVTRINDERVAAAQTGEPEQFTFKGWNDETVHGYVVKPAGFEPGEKYPVAFLIHGGPQGSFGNDFHYRWNPQAYAGAGYAAVMVDFHGSVGYGQAFTDSIRGDWGGKPLEDLQQGLAAALARYDWLDGDKVCALGASYGGYMINWIAGNWPDRFRCLVNHDGNLDERLAYYDTEELWFPEWDHEGTPWSNPEGYEKHNPVNFVQHWKTPMLVIHGALDYRVVDTQGLSTFTALQRRGIPSKLVYFPDENHWVLKPHNSVFWHDTVIGWLDRWLREPAGER